MKYIDLGLVNYDEADQLQHKLLNDKKQGKDKNDYLILSEFHDIITLGRNSNLDNILTNDIPIKKISRGGDVTYHGPGQIVIYPVIDLNNLFKDVHKYIRLLEEIIIKFLAEYDVCGARREGYTGVWVGNEKIASIGVGVSRWITYHGIGLNINTNLKKFDSIVPCGIKDKKMTSLQKILGKSIDMLEVKEKLRGIFQFMNLIF